MRRKKSRLFPYVTTGCVTALFGAIVGWLSQAHAQTEASKVDLSKAKNALGPLSEWARQTFLGIELWQYGGVFGLLALSNKNEYDLNAKDSDGKIIHDETTDQREGIPLKESGERNALIADVLYGVGIAALITGVCLHLFWDAGGAPATSVSPLRSIDQPKLSCDWISAGKTIRTWPQVSGPPALRSNR